MNKLKTLAAILCPWWIIYRQNRVIEKQKGKIDALSDVLVNPRIVGMAAAEKQVEIGLKGPMVELVAAVLEGLIEGCPEAENYLEMQPHSPKGRFVVIITRPGTGLTPHQLRENAEHRAERLEKENVKLRHALNTQLAGKGIPRSERLPDSELHLKNGCCWLTRDELNMWFFSDPNQPFVDNWTHWMPYWKAPTSDYLKSPKGQS